MKGVRDLLLSEVVTAPSKYFALMKSKPARVIGALGIIGAASIGIAHEFDYHAGGSMTPLYDHLDEFNEKKWSEGFVNPENQSSENRYTEDFGDTKSMNRISEISIEPGEIISSEQWAVDKINNGETFTLFTGVQEIFSDPSLSGSDFDNIIVDKINSGEEFALVDVEIALKGGKLIDIRTGEVFAEVGNSNLTAEDFGRVEKDLGQRYSQTFAGDQAEQNRIEEFVESRWDDNEQVVGFQIDYGIHPKDLLLKIIESGDKDAMRLAGVMDGDQYEERFFDELTRSFANNVYQSDYVKEMVEKILD